MTKFRFTNHYKPDGTWCRWSLVDVVAPEQRAQPDDRHCAWDCPDSDIESYEREGDLE
jgi:hypothetical protein